MGLAIGVRAINRHWLRAAEPCGGPLHRAMHNRRRPVRQLEWKRCSTRTVGAYERSASLIDQSLQVERIAV